LKAIFDFKNIKPEEIVEIVNLSTAIRSIAEGEKRNIYRLLSAVTAKNYFRIQLVGSKKNHGAVIIPKAILTVLALFLSFIFLYKIK